MVERIPKIARSMQSWSANACHEGVPLGHGTKRMRTARHAAEWLGCPILPGWFRGRRVPSVSMPHEDLLDRQFEEVGEPEGDPEWSPSAIRSRSKSSMASNERRHWSAGQIAGHNVTPPGERPDGAPLNKTRSPPQGCARCTLPMYG